MSPSHPWCISYFITGRYWLPGCLVRYVPGHISCETHALVNESSLTHTKRRLFHRLHYDILYLLPSLSFYHPIPVIFVPFFVTDVLMARVPEMVSGKISFARGIQCCPNFFYFFCPISVSISWRTCVYIYISDCVESVYELPSLPNKTASETFLHKSGAARGVGCIFIIGALTWRWVGEMDKTLYNLLLKQEVVAAPVTSIFSFTSHSSRRPLL